MEHFEKIGNSMFKCKHCGTEVPSGLYNIATHQTECKHFPTSKLEPLTYNKLKELFSELFYRK